MAKPELGNKRVCVSCATRFFDLLKQPAVCPKCSTEQPAEQPRLRRAPGNVADEKRRPKAAVVPGLEDADVEVEVAEEEGEEDVLEDTSDLEDDAEGIAVDVETETGDEER
ncbi:MAG: TIGR02300 family protein [Alphaproteobacteria bacterium]|nr:TIGR02300 family protein [Alphaproteobacteria bacterium]